VHARTPRTTLLPPSRLLHPLSTNTSCGALYRPRTSTSPMRETM
jgi:hypothetical protein